LSCLHPLRNKDNDHADKKEKSAIHQYEFFKKSKQENKPKDGINFPTVGIGASAGGLETITVQPGKQF